MSGGTNEGTDASAQINRSAMKSLLPNTVSELLPWWKKGKIRPSPFDKNGNECKRVPND